MNWVSMLHTLLIIYMIVLPFVTNSLDMLFLHIAILMSIVFHWVLNNDVCALTLFEQQVFPETPKDDLFVQRLVGPVYNIRNVDTHLATYAILLFTVYRYYTLRAQHKTLSFIPIDHNSL
jgi:hypothetical protein